MDANTLVALFLTILMVVLSGMAIIGGHRIDKKAKEAKEAGQQTESE